MYKILIISIIYILAFSSTFSFAQTQWKYKRIDIDTLQGGNAPNLVLGADGSLHATFWNEDEDRLYYGKKNYNTNLWAFEIVNLTKPGGFRSALVLDSIGQPHIAYFENVGGQMQVRYAHKPNNSTWHIESISTQNWGIYGPEGMDSPGYIQAAISIYLRQNLLIVTFFDGRFIACDQPPAEFGLELYRALKTPGGWDVRSFGDFPAFNPVNEDVRYCEGKAGARYGEFCQIQADRWTGKLSIFTVAKVNGELWRLQPRFPDSLQLNWDYSIIDLNQNHLANGHPKFRVLQTFEGVSSIQTPDSVWHLFYTLSDQYGRNVGIMVADDQTNRLLYSRVRPDGVVSTFVFPESKADNRYRAFTSCAAKGNDTLFVTYAYREKSAYYFSFSTDGGMNWNTQILAATPTPRQAAPIIFNQDSLHILYYDGARRSLMYASKHVNDGQWNFERLTLSQRKGTIITSDGEHFAYFEPLQKILYYGKEQAGSFQLMPVAFNRMLGAAQIHYQPNGFIRIIYTDVEAKTIRLLTYNGNAWDDRILQNANAPFIVTVGDETVDKIQLVFAEIIDASSRLQYIELLNGGVIRNETITSSSNQTIGEYPSLTKGADGSLHVGYFHRSEGAVYYATLPPNSTWNTEKVIDYTNKIAGYWTTTIYQHDKPSIAYLVPIDNRIELATRIGFKTWQIDTIIEMRNAMIEGPIHLKYDNTDGKRYVLYNEFNGFSQLTFAVQPDTLSPWYRSPVLANPDQMANAYTLNIVQDTICIYGRNTRKGSTGLGQIKIIGYEAVGKFLDNVAQRLKVYPNPTQGTFYLNLPPELIPQCELTVFDLYGRQVYHQSLAQANDALPCKISLPQGLTPGVYSVQLKAIQKKHSYYLKLILTD